MTTVRSNLRQALVTTLRSLSGAVPVGARRRIHSMLAQATADQPETLLSAVVETMASPRGDIRFYCLGELSLWRAHTLLSKEPETIEWIDGLGADAVLWDIGANVGVYSLYAGIDRRTKVLAFEPSAANYVLLNRNIEANNLSQTVKAYCLAFADGVAVGDLHMTDTAFGSALNSFGEPVDHEGRIFKPKFLQGMISFSIDSFIDTFQPDFPTHMKIDVDGIEDKIIKGAARTLADPRLKALSIELDANRPDYTNAVLADIEAAGLVLKAKRHAPMFDDSPYAGIFNYQFDRA